MISWFVVFATVCSLQSFSILSTITSYAFDCICWHLNLEVTLTCHVVFRYPSSADYDNVCSSLIRRYPFLSDRVANTLIINACPYVRMTACLFR
jgi:hypothetical protein